MIFTCMQSVIRHSLQYIFVLICCTTFSQTKRVDSIRALIHAAVDDRSKLAHILDYCDEYQSLNRDTAYNYALLALDLARPTGDIRNIARAELAFANSYYIWGWVDSALAVTEAALNKYTASNARVRDVYFKLLRQKAFCFGGISENPRALEVLYRLLDEAEQYNDSITLATTCNSLASVLLNMDKPGEALQWISKASAYTTGNSRYDLVNANILINSANAHMQLGKKNAALNCIRQALPLSRQAQNLNTLATALRIQSNLYMQSGENDVAESALREMMAIRNTLNGVANITDDNLQLANFYASSGQLDKAIKICKDNLATGDPENPTDSTEKSYTNRINLRLAYFEALAGFYKQAGLQQEYVATLEQIIVAKDSFYASNSAEALAEMQTRYETEQKEKTIIQQKYDITRKNFLLYGSVALLVLAGIIFYLLFRDYRRKQLLRLQAAMAEEKAASMIAVRDAEEKERKRIAADLHDNLGVQANAILYNAALLKHEDEHREGLVDDLHETAQQMLLNLRETLWAMKSNDIAAPALWLRVISFSKQMGRHYPKIQFITHGVAPEQLHLSSARALHIVMILQEAVQNAVKHSGAHEIILVSSYTDHNWNISVTDNGSGFQQAAAFAKNDSHGLKNMQQRAVASAVSLHIQSEQDRGTVIKLDIPFA